MIKIALYLMGTTENYLAELRRASEEIDLAELSGITEVLKKAYDNNRSIFIIGNGGSASTATHFACDLGKGAMGSLYDSDKKRFRVCSLTDNCSTMTAIGNDISYEDIFSQQLRNLALAEDVLIALTASGNSPNILRAIDYANSKGLVTIGFLGFDGGKAAEKLPYKIIVRSNNYGVVEDLHLTLEHIICENLKEKLNSSSY